MILPLLFNPLAVVPLTPPPTPPDRVPVVLHRLLPLFSVLDRLKALAALLFTLLLKLLFTLLFALLFGLAGDDAVPIAIASDMLADDAAAEDGSPPIRPLLLYAACKHRQSKRSTNKQLWTYAISARDQRPSLLL